LAAAAGLKEETMKIEQYAVAATTALAVGIVPASAALRSPVNVSGYEYLLGSSCTIDAQPATCGVQFGGWTGGRGQVPNGWRPFPGNGKGLWKATVNYAGRAAFGSQVDVLGGSFDLLLTSGRTVSGNVTGGTVTWPAAGQSTVCGLEVAEVSVSIRYRAGARGTGSFDGCLHDLPAGSVIPPKIWGTLR
jgi:hypothetical protein